MDITEILKYVFILIFVCLMCWTKSKEITKYGDLYACYRGFRAVSPIIYGFYIYMMYNLILDDSSGDLEGRVFAGFFFTLFAVFLSYFITRKVILKDGVLTSFSLLTGNKSLILDEITDIKELGQSNSVVIYAPNIKIKFYTTMLSGGQELFEYIKNHCSNKRVKLTPKNVATYP